ncbi:MAG: hypothetical protein AAFR38_08190 [Planctomycetota bacterium]
MHEANDTSRAQGVLADWGEGAAPAKKYSRIDVSIGLVFGLAALAVLGMRQVATGGSRGASEVAVDLAAGPAAGDAAGKLDERTVLAALDRVEESRSDDLTGIARSGDPFLLASAFRLPEGLEADEIVPGMDPYERTEAVALAQRQQARDELQSTVDALVLEAVMSGSRAAARISGRTVRVGDELEGGLVIARITGRRVVLEGGGESFELQLARP